ncbi:beta-aspartyl-peptidase [Marinicella litoralis]|uniref:Isoaspartyl dipeptidase n=1 Tax=Marinicella litoralis TaxID=644220 RepID=A0A4R6XQD0_9GAMM|nr:beta-aspartyl-peptidase [Marinicella litoralis]TDR20619.1 beta-aspartyl-dipeptidase (metallo-type) [Marinicella litoralis]
MIHLLRNVHVYAPEDLGNCHVLVAAGKVVAISHEVPHIEPSLLTTDQDYAGKKLIPGLIDGHAHITGGGGETGFSSKVPAVHLSEYTQAGVTTVVGLLGTDDLTRSTSSLVAQVYALRESGLSAYCYTGGYHIPLTTLTGSVKSDIVHIEPILGVGELAISDHRSSQPTFDEVARIAGDAHVAGLMTGKAGIVHFHLGDGDRGMDLINDLLQQTEIPARVLNPTHCNRKKVLFDQACQLTRLGCYIDVTAFPVAEDEDGLTAADAFKQFKANGFPPDKFTISSDGGGCLPHFDAQGELLHMDFGRNLALSETLKELLDAGLATDQVLPAFTSNVAKLLRLNTKGQVKVGLDADLVILDTEHQIQDVMAMGQWHRKNHQTLIYGGFETNK